MSTAVVGIGFIAILQMTNFSIQSIDNSGERTKANYLTSMIAEDVIGSKNSLYGINSDSADIVYDPDGSISLASGGDASGVMKFSRHLENNGWQANLDCGGGPSLNANATNTSDAATTSSKQENIYETQEVDAPRNKEAKWREIFDSNRYLKCRGENDIKRMRVYKICRWGDVCDLTNENVYDDGLYIGRIQINLNNGKKRKFLYFQADYKIRK